MSAQKLWDPSDHSFEQFEHHCASPIGCGRIVPKAGTLCDVCGFVATPAHTPAHQNTPVEKLLAAATLLLATEGKDREAFLDHLETVAHLVSVIQYQTHQAAQTKTNEQKEK